LFGTNFNVYIVLILFRSAADWPSKLAMTFKCREFLDQLGEPDVKCDRVWFQPANCRGTTDFLRVAKAKKRKSLIIVRFPPHSICTTKVIMMLHREGTETETFDGIISPSQDKVVQMLGR
jgi:hypothetical protein